MFSRIRAVLIDLSGTIHIDSNEIPGSIAALKRLQQSGLQYKFVTNTTKESQNYLHKRLKSIGFEIEKEEIFTSLIAARDYLASEKLKPHLLVADEALEDFEDIVRQTEESNCGEAVVVGLAPKHFHYDSLNIAFDKLLNASRLVAIHQGRYFKTSKGLALGPGPFVKALAYAAGISEQEVTTVGKPEAKFFSSALESLGSNLRPEEAVMIGDDVRDDVGGALAMGMKAVLVQTGKYRSGDEETIDPGPTKLVPTFAEAIDLILGQC